MELYFIRHAQSANNALWENTGSSDGRHPDPDLTEKGVRQALYLASFLKTPRSTSEKANHTADRHNRYGFGLTHLYCSLMKRAVRTAAIVAQALNMPLYGHADLHENGGVYLDDPERGEPMGQGGLSRTELLTLYPDLILPPSVTETGWWNRPFETEEERIARARRVWAWLLERHAHTEDRVAFFSHAGFYHTFLTTLLGATTPDGAWFTLSNCAITRLDISSDGVWIVYANRVDFLPDALL
ncbi:histidine phosphatase family protein [uncultured Thermanaerothrix sp.]|uniref:histidine phosphatase family protein n=1 Tax=uncultured Thermanaerothrix sp. TaxID=1195149 RepID=UPI0026023C5F|nr:histidine phosphatase family protein [uncultured Thermanaerothrix sp.]